MKSEATALIEIIRVVALVAGFFGVVISVEEQAAIAGAIAGVVLAVSALLAIYNRHRVYSQATTERLVSEAAARGSVPGKYLG